MKPTREELTQLADLERGVSQTTSRITYELSLSHRGLYWTAGDVGSRLFTRRESYGSVSRKS